MRGQMPVALFAILLGAVETAAGLQEVVYLGILRSETEPLTMGALGTVAGVMLLAAGIAFLVSSRLTGTLVRAAAYVSVPVFFLIGVIKHYPAWPSTLVGIVYPLFLLFFWQMLSKSRSLSAS
jgi:hypothetical protein